jgi:translocation and assembly module TamA
MRFIPRLATAAVLLFIAGQAQAAATVDRVEIRGFNLDNQTEALMVENINAALSFNDALGKRLGESRLEYLVSETEVETREALEPFGYYSPTITVNTERSGSDDAQRIAIIVQVDKGEPVRVRRSDLSIEGAGGEDRYLKEDLQAFYPRIGDIFDHTQYETSKTQIVRRLAERGYFDADFTQRRVAVTRAERAAEIDLTWASGIRYDMGPTTFHQTQFRPGLLDQLVYWEEGSYFHQGKLDRLRESLVGLDYFANIDIQANPEEAVEGRVPVDVNLTLAKRDVYTTGVSYGTESGAGVRFGLERRYVNSRGHKFSAQLDYAQKRKSFLTQYRMPAFKWLDGWYAVGLRAYDEQTDYIDTRLLELIGSRSGQITDRWTALASVHALRERWSYNQRDASGAVAYEYSTLTYPQISGQYVGVDSRTFPRKGFSGSVALRGGVEGAGSDASFVQLQTIARWYKGLGENNRLLVRGEAGTTSTNSLVAMPPSLRFYAGGDRSIRGYAFREVGPRLANDYALGAKHVVTGSVEYEHYLNDSAWGGAAFVDSGSAFDDTPDFKTGVGIGLRWRSPVGPVRIDIARGLNDPDSSLQLYLNIGADL